MLVYELTTQTSYGAISRTLYASERDARAAAKVWLSEQCVPRRAHVDIVPRDVVPAKPDTKVS